MLTDNEIIKALEWMKDCKDEKISNCEGCPLLKHYPYCDELSAEIALDLINRLKAKNQELEKMIVTQRGLIDYQKAKVERLQKENEELGKAIARAYELNCFLEASRKCVRNEAYKEFAERVKPIIDEIVDLMIDDNEGKCIIEDCKKHSSVPCMNEYCVLENKEAWKSRIDRLIKELSEVSDNGNN